MSFNQEDAIKLIWNLLIKGKSKESIFKHLKGESELSEPDFQQLYAIAIIKMSESPVIAVEAERNKGLARLNVLYNKSFQSQDFGACLAIQKEINSLLTLKREPEASLLPDLNSGYKAE